MSSKQDADVRKSDDYFGVCPECNESDGYLNIGRNHWGVCHKHKTKWCIGSNLFSSWRDQTKEDFERTAERLKDYREVEEQYPLIEAEETKRKAELLEKYATKKPKAFLQYDGLVHAGTAMPWDEDEDCICCGGTWELMQGVPVRVLISEDACKEDVLRLLEKISNWIEWDGLQDLSELQQKPNCKLTFTPPVPFESLYKSHTSVMN